MDAAHISIRICGRVAIGVLIDQNPSDTCPRSRIACQHLFRLVEGDAALHKVREIHRTIASDEGACSARAVRPVDRIPIEITVLPRARQIKRLSRRIDPGKIKVQRLKAADEACRIAALRVQRIARAGKRPAAERRVNMGAVHIDDIVICCDYAGAADHSSHCHMIQIDNISVCRSAVTVSAPDGICTTRIHSHRIAACLAAGDAPGAAPVNNVRMRICRPCLDKENSVAVRLSSVRLGTAAVDIHRCAAREDELVIVAVVPVRLICARSCRPAAVDIIVSAAQRNLVHARGVSDPRASAVSKYLAVLRDHDRSRPPLIHITGTRRPRRENAETAR